MFPVLAVVFRSDALALGVRSKTILHLIVGYDNGATGGRGEFRAYKEVYDERQEMIDVALRLR